MDWRIDNDFIREYELYKESIKDYFYGSLYKVKIKLSKEGIKAGKIEHYTADPGCIKHDDRTVTVIMKVPYYDEGFYELEIILYYKLNGGEYGTFIWECLRADWDDLKQTKYVEKVCMLNYPTML